MIFSANLFNSVACLYSPQGLFGCWHNICALLPWVESMLGHRLLKVTVSHASILFLNSSSAVLDLAGLDVGVELLEGVRPRPAAAAGKHQQLGPGVVIALS